MNRRPKSSYISRKTCPREDQKMPTFREVDHRGPGLLKNALQNATSQFSSHYRIQYKKKRFEPSVQYIRNDHTLMSNFPTQYETTHHREFGKKTPVNPGLQMSRSQPYPIKFTSRSIYQAQYPNWGPMQPSSSYRPADFQPNEIKLAAKSSYSETFQAKPFSIENNEIARKLMERDKQSQKMISPVREWLGEEKKTERRDQYPAREKGLKHQFLALRPCTSQYLTTYQRDFLGSVTHRPQSGRYMKSLNA